VPKDSNWGDSSYTEKKKTRKELSCSFRLGRRKKKKRNGFREVRMGESGENGEGRDSPVEE